MKATVFLVLLVFFLTSAPTIAAEKPVVTVSSGHFPPWISQELPAGGYLRVLITEAFSHGGYEVSWRDLPWTRALRELEWGEAAVSAVWAEDKERDTRFLTSTPVYEERVVFFRHRNNEALWKDIEAPNIVPVVAIPLGYTLPESVSALADTGRIRLLEVRTAESVFRMLREGRIEFGMYGLYSGLYLLNKLWPEGKPHDLVPSDYELEVRQGHLLFDPDHEHAEELVSAFNEGLRHLHHSGRAAQLKEKLLSPLVAESDGYDFHTLHRSGEPLFSLPSPQPPRSTMSGNH